MTPRPPADLRARTIGEPPRTLEEWRSDWNLLGWPVPWWAYAPWYAPIAVLELARLPLRYPRRTGPRR